MKSILYIINLHFWKSITGPFFAFAFPVIFIAILATLLGYDQLLGSIVAIPATTIGLTVLPTALFEFKNSSLLKRIGVTPIKPSMFILTISAYYILIMIVSTITTIGIAILILIKYLNNGRVISDSPVKIIAPSMIDMLKYVNWGGVVWGTLMNIIVSTSMGIFVSSISKSTLSIQGIGIPILIISEFLAAQVLPVSMVKAVDGLYYISYITPFKYPTALIIESWNGQYDLSLLTKPVNGIIQLQLDASSNIFNIHQTFATLDKAGKPIDIYTTYDKVLNLVMPFAWTLLFGGITLKTFKWSTR